jgi:hypothetical protein
MMDRYVILAVAYEPDATDGKRSLEWLVLELPCARASGCRVESDGRHATGAQVIWCDR